MLGNVRILVLDEADEMLDLGFLPDIEKMLQLVPAKRQTMLFSATMPGPIVALARTFLDQPIQIRAEHGTETPRTDHIDQFAYRAHAMDKAELLARVLQVRDRGLTLIFTRTKRTAAKVADDLATRGFAAAAVHGDLGQGAREQALRAFRSGKVDVLVATDVAARGWDVEGISHVVNYQAPEDEMTYVHRIGRTARAGNAGQGDHARRLGRRAALEADLRSAGPTASTSRPRPTPPRASLPRVGHPGGCDRRAAAHRAHPRGAGRRAARGSRRAGFPGASKRQPRPGPRGPGTCSSRRRAPRRGR